MQQWWTTLSAGWALHWLDWLIFGATLLAAPLLATFIIWVVRSVGARLVARSKSTLDDRLLVAALRPLRWVIHSLALLFALHFLRDQIASFQASNPYGILLKVVEAVVILTVTNLVGALLKTLLDWYLHEIAPENSDRWDRELIPLVRRVTMMILYFIAASAILADFHVNITALVTTAGVASLAVALAAQETLSNMLGGFIVLVDRPFRVGDVIQLANGTSGEVIEIGLRSTRIKLFDGNALVVPNKDIASQAVTNLALPTPRAAIRQTINVAYQTDLDKAKAILMDVMKSHPLILHDPEPSVAVTALTPEGISLFFSCWVESYRARFTVTDELLVSTLKAFREHAIEIPFPQRKVHLAMGGEERVVAQALLAEMARGQAGNSPAGEEG
jgi:MscS family membrane protein